MPHTFRTRMTSQSQRGAATLVIIMVLFFMISMVAAYTSRNLIFEQRTGANQYRSSQAFEAGEAAVEWALMHLNAGRVTPSCTASTNEAAGADPSFRERYLTIAPDTGAIVARTATGAGSVEPRCVFDGGAADATQWRWNCHCPLANTATATAAITAPLTPGPAPAFVMEMSSPFPGRPDILLLEVASCTKLSADCVNFTATRGNAGDGVASVTTLLALRGALTRVPAGAITLDGSLQPLLLGTTLSVTNSDAGANGVTLHVSGARPLAVPAGLTLAGLPGAAAGLSTAVFGDNSLAPADFLDSPLARVEMMFSSSERKFGLFFGLRPDAYRRQPGLPVLDCSGGCDSATIRRTLILNPGRPLWLTGAGGTVTLDGSVGTLASPALLIVEGDVAISAGATFTGLLYGRKPNWTWTVAGSATVRGGAVGEGNLSVVGGGAATVNYDAAVLRALRVAQGTFVRVPGSWRDF